MLCVNLYVIIACVIALVLLRYQEAAMADLGEELHDVSQLTGFDERTIMNIIGIFLAVIWPVTIVKAIKIYIDSKRP